MLIQYILIPVFVLVARTFVVLWFARHARGEVTDARHDALLLDPFDVLFYVLVAYLIPTRHAGVDMVVLGWIYAAFRIVQAGFDLRGTTAPSGLFGVVARVVLLIMWVVFCVEILAGI